MELLKKLCDIHSPSSEEFRVRDFIIQHVKEHSHTWKQQPELYYGKGYQDTLMVKLGEPTHAFIAHMDSIGFMVGYNNELTPIGSPAMNKSCIVRNGHNETINIYYDNQNKMWSYKGDKKLAIGTTWTWIPSFTENGNLIETPFLDNRLSIYVLLKIASQLTNVVLAFSTYEETKYGGTADMLTRMMFERWTVDKIIVTDITWVTSFIQAGKGVVVSLRDVGIPRCKFRDQVEAILCANNIIYQKEVEKSGGSDGTAISTSIYPIDWLFIGAPEVNPHGIIETVHKSDIDGMEDAYLCLNKYISDIEKF